ncbi:recombinase family protein [Nonomuraea composti]|uniref:recombinase family protein n=1 Tax=Nonomuraea composti TaxID=2720023 RepID=UPI0019801C99|nr:recombinase family protein [Nonomuraea sp. FMUSA5-5]
MNGGAPRWRSSAWSGTDKQNTQRQHDALDPICLKVIEEKASGKLATADRPDLLTALSHIREGDLLTVQEVDRLNLIG